MVEELDEAWLSRRYYGGDLPAEAERSLHLAAATYADTAAAQGHLDRAAALAPGHLAVDLGLYKFHLYKAHTTEALRYGERLLDHAARGIGLNSAESWRTVTPAFADFHAIAAAPRFFLFCLKAVGTLNVRLAQRDPGQFDLNRLQRGRALLAKVRELDPDDRFAAQALLDVADRAGRGDDDD